MKTRIAVLAALAWTVAPAVAHAQGVTNPAKNPNPISVTIDGQTFTDGRDTLPGYDDVACTPIPGVQYDFAEGLIHYYDGEGKLLKSAEWSEWARISSYQTWLDDQQAPTPTATPVRTATPTRTATPAPTTQSQQQQQPTTTTTTQPQTQQSPAAAQNQAAQNAATNTSSSSTTSPSTKNRSSSKRSSSNRSRSTSKSSSSSSSKRSSSTSPSSTSTPSATSTPASSSSPAATDGETTTSSVDPLIPATDPGDTDGGAPVDDGAVADIAGAAPVVAPDGTVTAPAPSGAQVVAAAGPGVASNLELASQTADLAFGDSPTRLAGVAILVALVAIGFFTLALGEIRNQLFGRR